MEIIGYAVAALVIFYLVWIFKLASALRNANIDLPSAIPDISVSIVVAMRNEQEHILNLLNALRAQKNPPLQTELILIDDFSTDNTLQQIESWKVYNSDFNIRVIAMSDFPNAGKGKKDAILLGINSAMHDYIITTDADCTMQANWLNTMCNYFISARPALLAGPVMLHADILFGKLQQMEMILLQALTCATFKLNKPVMCNAANLMFRKMDYLSLNKNALNAKTASGDDIFLMLALKQKGLKMDYCCHQQCVVKTNAINDFSDFVHQRIRWASKIKLINDKDILTAGAVVMIANLLLLFFFGMAIACITPWYYFLFLFTLKLLCDVVLINFVSQKLEMKQVSYTVIIIFQIIFPFYNILIAALSIFGKYKWKGRGY